MKTTIFAVLLFMLVLLGISYAQSRSTTNGSLFQIVSGDFLMEGRTASSRQPGVFRINTATGQTSIFVHVVDDQGKLREFWQEIR